MKEFTDKVAVITGAGSGIGRGLAERCAREGMRVVLADIEKAALLETQEALRSAGAQVLAVPTDVAKPADVAALAQKTLDTFGAVHLLFNNAGVGGLGAGPWSWDNTLADWEWVLGVNLWGVIHGLRVFVPMMLAQDTEGHIVNTASMAGLLSFAAGSGAPYQVAKHGVVALSERLYHELAYRKAKVKVSVLCPGWVKTRIMDADRNRPAELRNEAGAPLTPDIEKIVRYIRQSLESGMLPGEVAVGVFQAITEERFYILTDPEMLAGVERRMEDIVQLRNPSPLLIG